MIYISTKELLDNTLEIGSTLVYFYLCALLAKYFRSTTNRNEESILMARHLVLPNVLSLMLER